MSETIWSKPHLDALIPWLEAAYPEEGCALLLARATGEREVILCENLANKYHHADPESYPRTARDFYMINPLELARAERRGDRILAIIHSHVDVGDYFSQEDIAGATMPRFDPDDPLEPAYPGTDYMVVSVRQGRADRAQVFAFEDSSATFEAHTTLYVDGPGEYRVVEGAAR